MESADSDWAVTCIIYAQETSGSALRLDEAAGVVRAETTVSVDSKGILLMALRADGIHEFTVEPRFPLLKLVVEYAPNDLFTPVAAYVEDADLKVRKSHLFHPDWMEWINAELVNLIAATEPSSSILEFIMHDSLRFIEPVGTIESDIGTLSVLRHDDMWLRPQAGTFTVSKEEHIYCSFDTASLLPQPDSVQDLFSPSASGKGKISSRQPEQSRIQNLVRQLRLSVCHILPFECAICFDKCLSADATRLFCGHVFCTECIQHYLAITMRELARPKWRHSYPFVCPNAGCSQTINLAYDQTLTRLLSKKDIQKFMDVAALGDVMAFIAKGQAPARKPSRALSITSCPRTGCRKKSMMSFENTTLVFCDFCSRTWCERCLSRVTEHHPSDECSPLFAVDLVRRYRKLDDPEQKALADQRNPWLCAYASWMESDFQARRWTAQNASLCPNCGAGIEKTEGCHHITCSECESHFCYECGKEFPADIIYKHKCSRDKVKMLMDRLDSLNFD